jgi:Ca-activated chloride channel family protein
LLAACLLLIIVGLIAFVGPDYPERVHIRSRADGAPLTRSPSLLYASSAQVWFQQAITDFNNTQALSADGKRIVVVGHPMASGAMIETLIKGDSPYEIVAPADKVWMDILADRRKQRGETALPVGACTSVARSPVVMITWRPMAEVLGWPDREFTWHDVADLALSPSAWQGYDHPEWGTLTFAHAHPILSQGGLASILGEAYAAAPLTANDVQSDVVKSYLRVVERSVARYGSDTGSLIKNMADKGQRYVHVAIGYESDVIANHRGDDGLVAIYPKETFVADYATCVIGGNAAAEQLPAIC